MLAQFSIYPMQPANLSKEVAKAIEALESTGLEYRLGPMSTVVEGDWEQVMSAIRRCHDAVAETHDRVITSITIDDRRKEPHPLADMVPSVERHLGRAAKH